MVHDRNLLKEASSPYLLQHANNPVHWRQWGADALAEAKAEGKPILLSIGYAACHWCHVMAHESFEDAATAAEMNGHYINIKVDREERPDIDHYYMSALQAMGEQGGWPLTMFLTPEGVPFWGGTYFPPEPRWGKPSFRQVLAEISGAWRREPGKIAANAAQLAAHLARLARTEHGRLPGDQELSEVAASLMAAQDTEQGGFRGAPKFPNAPLMRFLWQDSFRSGRTEQREAVRLLLRRMSMGGIYDHLGGGYARYATDREWRVPHFEKMLYDNAQILELLALAFAETPDPLFASRARETVGWLEREMCTGDGKKFAFAASQDADSEGEEGKFYVWDTDEITSLLGSQAEEFTAAYDVSEGGNWEGRTILHRVVPLGDPAFEARLAKARALLFASRAQRVAPGRDDKVLADWNGLTVAALTRAASVFDEPRWLALAGDVFDFLNDGMGQADGRFAHAWRGGRVSAAGLLEDQAAMARAALALYEATGEARRREAARRIVAATEAHFAEPDGAFYGAADDARDLPGGAAARELVAEDHATPCGNGMLAEVFTRLFHLTGEDEWRVKAERLIGAFMGRAGAMVQSPGLLGAADLLMHGASVVISGGYPTLASMARKAPDPAVTVLEIDDPRDAPPNHPAAGKPRGAIMCRGGVCGLPVFDPTALAAMLRRT
ncbi:MAG: thioredoxin domain-containing protein [Acetobacteraceae bacterium]